ncbi:MAG: dienelactone hydrolase, partial [Caulobacterales bacterium]|nr:dienelactone hydrolase [Caulobacterales bacterium]
MRCAWVAVAALVLSWSAAAGGPYAQPTGDAPELAALGPHPVGVHVESVARSGEAGLYPEPFAGKSIDLYAWYPARVEDPSAYETARYPFRFDPALAPERADAELFDAGLALRDAPAATGEPAPLVLISHGFHNSAPAMAYLGENLASKGFVVVATDHFDLPQPTEEARLAAIGEATVTRPIDILVAYRHAAGWAGDPAHPLHGAIDPENVSVAGFSLGGFGALLTIGAAIDPDGPFAALLPEPLVAAFAASPKLPEPRAALLLAPWGGGAEVRAFSADSLAGVTTPVFLAIGDGDDVSGYEDGAAWIFRSLTASDRHMLVYEHARHNIGVGPPHPELHDVMAVRERLDEPVWRKDRIMAINQHFATAFLTYHQGSEEERAAMAGYLSPP